MAIKMVREPSEAPNISNIDDIIPFRYAYGGQNGFVIGKGTEISNTVSGLNFTVNSGRLVLQGVECDIDATGVTITIDNIATKRYYTIYLEVNLGLNTATIKSEYDTATYPTIDAGDDLTENSTGIARLPLYKFTATNGIIGEVNKIVESVKYINYDFIKSVKVNDASKVNNLEIKRDNNGVLKIGDIIIPQKKLLWSGELKCPFASGNVTLQLSNVTFQTGDLIEIVSRPNASNYKISSGICRVYIENVGNTITGFQEIHRETAADNVTWYFDETKIEIDKSKSEITLYSHVKQGFDASGNATLAVANDSYITDIYKIIE